MPNLIGHLSHWNSKAYNFILLIVFSLLVTFSAVSLITKDLTDFKNLLGLYYTLLSVWAI